jgi:accessory gene regulator B
MIKILLYLRYDKNKKLAVYLYFQNSQIVPAKRDLGLHRGKGKFVLMYYKLVKLAFSGVIAQAESEEEKEVVIYGLVAIVSNIVTLFALLFIGGFSHNLLATIIYLSCLFCIRILAGGYHANTNLACLLSSIFIYSLIVVINSYISIEYNIILIVLVGIAYIGILFMAPILNGKRIFLPQEIKKVKMKIRIVLAVELIVTIALYQVNYELYKFAIYAMLTEGVIGTMGKIKYWDLNKKNLLKGIMSLAVTAAVTTAGLPCSFVLYEPKIPEALKDKLVDKQ